MKNIMNINHNKHQNLNNYKAFNKMFHNNNCLKFKNKNLINKI